MPRPLPVIVRISYGRCKGGLGIESEASDSVRGLYALARGFMPLDAFEARLPVVVEAEVVVLLVGLGSRSCGCWRDVDWSFTPFAPIMVPFASSFAVLQKK